MKVEQFYNKNQFIIRGGNSITFQSYDSTIAVIEDRVLTLGRDWDYSRTTLKHLYLFLDDEARYKVDFETKNIINEILNSKNKRAKIQKLIDENIINYNENL